MPITGTLTEIAVSGALWALWLVVLANSCPLGGLFRETLRDMNLGGPQASLVLLGGLGYALAIILRSVGETTVREARNTYTMQYLGAPETDQTPPSLGHWSWRWSPLIRSLRAADPDVPWSPWSRPAKASDWRSCYDRARDLLYAEAGPGLVAHFGWNYHAKHMVRYTTLPLVLTLLALSLRIAGQDVAPRSLQWAGVAYVAIFGYLGWLRLWWLVQPDPADLPGPKWWLVEPHLDGLAEPDEWSPRVAEQRKDGRPRHPGWSGIELRFASSSWVWPLVLCPTLAVLLSGRVHCCPTLVALSPCVVAAVVLVVVGVVPTPHWLFWCWESERELTAKRLAGLLPMAVALPLVALIFRYADSVGSLRRVPAAIVVFLVAWLLVYAGIVEHRLRYKWMMDTAAKFAILWYQKRKGETRVRKRRVTRGTPGAARSPS